MHGAVTLNLTQRFADLTSDAAFTRRPFSIQYSDNQELLCEFSWPIALSDRIFVWRVVPILISNSDAFTAPTELNAMFHEYVTQWNVSRQFLITTCHLARDLQRHCDEHGISVVALSTADLSSPDLALRLSAHFFKSISGDEISRYSSVAASPLPEGVELPELMYEATVFAIRETVTAQRFLKDLLLDVELRTTHSFRRRTHSVSPKEVTERFRWFIYPNKRHLMSVANQARTFLSFIGGQGVSDDMPAKRSLSTVFRSLIQLNLTVLYGVDLSGPVKEFRDSAELLRTDDCLAWVFPSFYRMDINHQRALLELVSELGAVTPSVLNVLDDVLQSPLRPLVLAALAATERLRVVTLVARVRLLCDDRHEQVRKAATRVLDTFEASTTVVSEIQEVTIDARFDQDRAASEVVTAATGHRVYDGPRQTVISVTSFDGSDDSCFAGIEHPDGSFDSIVSSTRRGVLKLAHDTLLGIESAGGTTENTSDEQVGDGEH